MLSKTIAASACSADLSGKIWHKHRATPPRAQHGISLIELMVGIAIGLLVIAVAMAALMVSRGVSGTVSDASGIQQQAAYAMRVISLQLRQAGSLRLNLDPGTTFASEAYLVPVAFETVVPPASSPFESFDPAANTLSGTATPVTLTMGYRRYTEPVFTNATEQALARNCLGGPADGSTDARLESTFQLTGNELQCNGNGAGVQPIVQNVANFQVRYLLQDNTTTPGSPTIRFVDASGVANWAQVQAVEVCLVLYGIEAIDLPAGSNYTDCDGATAVDMSTLAGARARRMHMVFRNVYQLRSQGLIGSVL